MIEENIPTIFVLFDELQHHKGVLSPLGWLGDMGTGQRAQRAALSGSRHKAPGSAGGYLPDTPSAQSRERILFVVTADHSMISWADNQQQDYPERTGIS